MKPSELLSDPAKWSRGFVCQPPGVDVDDAVAWCVYGALLKCRVSVPKATALIQDEIKRRYPGAKGLIGPWNDSPKTTHAEMLSVLRACDL